MDIYIAICEDRHIDVTVRVFSTPEKAIAYAKDFMLEGYKIRKTILTDGMKKESWIYAATYGVEGDSVRVEKRKIDEQ